MSDAFRHSMILTPKPTFTNSKITMMPTTTHKFNFKNIPYPIALRRIHALEYITELPLQTSPTFFKLKNTTHPVSYGPCTLISCDCEILGRLDNIRMFTDRPNESQIIVFLSEGIPYLHIHLILSRLVEKGCKLNMICTYYRNPHMIYSQMKPLIDYINTLQDDCEIGFMEEDANLNEYRRMIL